MDPALAAVCEEIASRLAVLADGSALPAAPLTTIGAGKLAVLAAELGLDQVATGLVAVAATVALDSRFGRLFVDLDPGRGRSRPRLDLALLLAGGLLVDPVHRSLLAESSVLRRHGIVTVADDDLPLPEWTVAVPERVIGHLLGSNRSDPDLLPLLAPVTGIEDPSVLDLARVLASGRWLVWLRDQDGAGRSLAATALGALDLPCVALDLDRLAEGRSLADVLPAALRETALAGGGLVVGPVDPRRDRAALRGFAVPPEVPVVLVSPRHWDPSVSAALPVVLQAPLVDAALRRPVWTKVVTELGMAEPDRAIDELSLMRVPPDRAEAVAATATGLAVARDEAVALRHLQSAALAEGAGRLDTLAHHKVPSATFDDLVLPAAITAELRSVAGRYRTRHVVRRQWGLDRHSRRGVTCLFAGASGTGKTLAAEVIAGDLGVDLFVIDLSQIVDKYVGETEKNLEKVFTEAERMNGVLLFDEADALFGKRGAVSSSNDRYANVEVAYLLQRMERHDGVAILTTNLRNNLDEAFTRRLDVICAFPDPGPDERLSLWQRHLPATVPQSDDVDLERLAKAWSVTGGVIRNITLTAAHIAADRGTSVDQALLIAAAGREHAKLGRLFVQP